MQGCTYSSLRAGIGLIFSSNKINLGRFKGIGSDYYKSALSPGTRADGSGPNEANSDPILAES